MDESVLYDNLPLPELKKLCSARGIERCSGRGITKKVLIAELRAIEAKKTRTSAVDSVSTLMAPSLEELLGRTLQQLRNECARLGLSGCTGKGITKAVLANRIREALERADNPSDNETRSEIPQSSPDRHFSADSTEEAASPHRKKVEQLRERLLKAETADVVREICRNDQCNKVEWEDLLLERDPELHGHIVEYFAVVDWRSVYENAVAFRARFPQPADFERATPATMRDYGVVWPAMVRAYPKMKEAAARIGDIEVLRDTGISAHERRKLVPSAGTREVALWLLEDLDASQMHKEFLDSVRSCNVTVALLLLDLKVQYDIKKALEAALLCRRIWQPLLMQNRNFLSTDAPNLLSKAYLYKMPEELGDIVLLLNEDALHHVLSPHLTLLAKNNEAAAVARVLKSERRSMNITLEDIQGIFVVAVEANAVAVVQQILLLYGQDLSLSGLLAKAAAADRREMAGLIFSYLPEAELQQELDDALEAATAAGATMRPLITEWIAATR